MTSRGPLGDHVIVRLADEGVPVGAISRALLRRSEDIRTILAEAYIRGELVEAPAEDWKPGTRRDDRAPTIRPIQIGDLQRTAAQVHCAFGVTPGQSRMLALLLARREAVTKTSLHIVYSGENSAESTPKVVDVAICHLRKKLPPEIKITTVWGRGYILYPDARASVLQILGEMMEAA